MKIRKNGKVINLTESDLRRIVRKVLVEQVDPDLVYGPDAANYIRFNNENWQVKSGKPLQNITDIQIKVTKSEKMPNVYTISYDFLDPNNEMASVKADFEKVKSGGYKWRTSFNQYNSAADLTNAKMTGPKGTAPAMNIFKMMAKPGGDATSFIDKDLVTNAPKVTKEMQYMMKQS